jgi:signal transduction histidine kinase/ActR/RegA family two-component response regulator
MGDFALALALFAVALWAELLLARATGDRFLFLAFSMAVAASGWVAGPIAMLFFSLLSAAAADYFLLGPGAFFRFPDRSDGLVLAGFVAGWTGVSLLVGHVQQRAKRERALRLSAERGAARSDRLAQVTAALGQARTSEAAIEASIQEPLHWLGADAGMFLLVADDPASANLVRAIGYQPDAVVPSNISLGRESPVSEAIRRAEPITAGATLALPIVIDRRVAAVVRLDFGEPRVFDADDNEFLSVLAVRAAQALDRTWGEESAHRARAGAESLRARADAELAERQKTEQALRGSETRYRALATRTTRLHALTAALSEAVTVNAVARAIVRQGKVVVGAAAGALTLLIEHGTQFDTMYADDYAADTRSPRPDTVEPGWCATHAVESMKPVFIGAFTDDWQEKYWRSASFAADGGYTSLAALPLVIEGAAAGVLLFHFSVPVNFDDEYQALLVSVAQHCTQALDRARLYEAAQHARAEAEAANRLKDDFVSIVSHELRTPLNAILGWASMLQGGTLDANAVPRAVESIHKNASRQAKLVDDLLDFSRITAGRATLDLEKVEGSALIRGIVESVTPLAAARQIEVRLDDLTPATLRADVRRLEQVFVNLLSNALKFTEPGGLISVATRLVEQTWEVRVSDNGKGIDPEFLPHVFDRFRQGDSTTTRNHGGLGLGLSIAKQLVEAHNGKIDVKSAGRDRGTTFIVSLPVAVHAVERIAEAGADAPSPKPRLDGVRVLIVDDEAEAREIIGQALEDCGASIIVTDRAIDALTILEHENIDVLLADIAMPDGDGYSLIRRVRASGARFAAIPAAALTAHARKEDRQMALAAGFQMHVPKPVEPFELARAITRLIQDGVSSPSPRIPS